LNVVVGVVGVIGFEIIGFVVLLPAAITCLTGRLTAVVVDKMHFP
jgi:hypothetical protein